VHKDYVAARNAGNIEYSNPIIEDVLGDTYGFIVFQEQFMLLGQKLAGFDKGESDKMRKTLVKKDLTSLGKKASEKDQLKIKFVDGAQKIGGMNKQDASALFDKIAYFSLYGFNKSHAISYAIVSYYGAWLLTHYEKEWLATCLQAENGNTKSMPKMMSEIKKLGLTFSSMDINTSANKWMWNVEQDTFVPPIDSLKGVGEAAVKEIMTNRPYIALDDLLYNEDGTWKHSKMNKRCFESLCKVEAFNSLAEFSNGVFDNHNQMMTLILDNYAKLKKNKYGMAITKAKKTNAESQLGDLIEGVIDIQDWSRTEKVAQYSEVMGGVPEELTFPSGILDRFKTAGINPIASIQGDERMIGWALFQEVQKKKTKNGKSFYRIKATDADNNYVWLKIWGGDAVDIDPYTIWLVDAKGDEQWGPSTSAYKIKPVVA
jgi:DNA polymerase-3 subunit alpha